MARKPESTHVRTGVQVATPLATLDGMLVHRRVTSRGMSQVPIYTLE